MTRAAVLITAALLLIAAGLQARRLIFSHNATLAQAAVLDFRESGRPAAVQIGGRTVTLRAVGTAIELRGLPCGVAEELDARTDDGNFATGRTRASVTQCTVGGPNDPVPVVAVALW